MSLTRRRFLETASLSLMASAALPSAFAEESHEPIDDRFSPEHLRTFNAMSAEKFEPLIGDKFAVTASNGARYSWTLVSVTAGTPLAAAATGMHAETKIAMSSQPSVKSFTLRFRGSGDPLTQDTYTVQHSALGAFPLFLVPGGPEANPPMYSAVFAVLNAPRIL
jgi:hypothetical protein